MCLHTKMANNIILFLLRYLLSSLFLSSTAYMNIRLPTNKYTHTQMYVCVYIYIYIHTHTHKCICVYIYIYIYIERERERETNV